MMTKRTLYALACMGFCGCAVETTHHHPPPGTGVVGDGTLTVDWTIGNSKNPDECVQGAATDIDITVLTLSGDNVGEYTQACEAFATRIELPPGEYSATAVLLDASGRDRTTAIDIQPFTIQGDDELDIPIDFPPGSFL